MRRVVGFWGAASLSIGVMAPTLAMSITGSAAAGQVGAAAPLAFALAAVGVLVVSAGFVRLSGRFSHAGSVYAFVGRTLGPRAGFVTGWALLGTYLVFPWVSVSGIAVFATAFLQTTGWAPGVDWYPLALGGWAVVGLLAAQGIRPTARWLLTLEAAAVVVILGLMAVIMYRIGAGTTPRGQAWSADVLRLPDGVGAGALVLAATVGFLAFAGFESAGSLGEETRGPCRSIPRAMVSAIVAGGIFYVACMLTQTLGFGVDRVGVTEFAGAAAPLDRLAASYVGAPMAALLDLVAVVSAVGAGLGCVVVAVRMVFALGRDGMLPPALGRVAQRTATPSIALVAELTLGLVLISLFRLAGSAPLEMFFTLATFGVLNLLVMYVVTNLAALRVAGGVADAVLPVLGALVAGYVLVRNIWPLPQPPLRSLPFLVLGWLVLGGTLLLARSSRAARLADALAHERALG